MPPEPRAFPEVRTLDDLAGDLAATHRQPAGRPGAPEATAATADRLEALERDGYVVIEGAIDDGAVGRIRTAAADLVGRTGRNAFEGARTQRAYSVLAKTRAADHLVDHPLVLPLIDALVGPGPLLSQLQIINLLPGEAAQLEHHDDAMYPVPRPRPPLGAATIWAIDGFTRDNGATVVLPGSHRWPSSRTPTDADERRSVTMPPGSCLVFVGTLWHGGGANRTRRPRLAVTAQYCCAWLRPQEAFTLSVPAAIAARLSAPVRSMLGYSIHPPFVGMVDGRHPQRLLDAVAPEA